MMLLGCAGPAPTASPSDTPEAPETTEDTGEPIEQVPAEWREIAALGQGASLVIQDGVMLASWVAEGSLWVARSDNAGVSFNPPVSASGDRLPMTSFGDPPKLAIGGAQVAVLFTDLLSGDGVGARGDLDTLGFGEVLDITAPTESTLTELMTGALSPEGELWGIWLNFSAGSVDLRLAREDDAFQSVDISSPWSLPCECCSLDLRFSSEGSPVAAWRSNLDNVRDIVVSTGANLDQQSWGSTTHWVTSSCPADGPKLSEVLDGTPLLTWSDASTGGPLAYLSVGDGDGGWSPEVEVFAGTRAQKPQLATGDSGIHVVASSFGEWLHAVSVDDGLSFGEASTLEAPDGRITQLTLAGDADIVALIAVSEHGVVWLHQLAP